MAEKEDREQITDAGREGFDAEEKTEAVEGEDQSEEESVSGDIQDPYIRYHALAVMISEVENQNSTAVSNIGFLTQKSGILTAFISLIFIEIIRIFDGTVMWWTVLMIMGSSIVLGAGSILYALNVPLGVGEDIDEEFDNGDYEEVMIDIFNEKERAINDSLDITDDLGTLLKIQVVLFLLGLVLFVVMEVTRCSERRRRSRTEK